MGAPEFVPVPTLDKARSYESPEVVPDAWRADRPGELVGRQPVGGRLGFQGPDQGYALKLLDRFRDRVRVADGESVDDALSGAFGIALRRASGFGRAPMVHDITVALTIWGFLDASPPAALVVARRPRFAGVANRSHHYRHWRELVDSVPAETLRLPHAEVLAAYPSRWQALVVID